MELRAAAVEATRERILSAAADVFLERWYDDVTIAAIAERAGVSGQTVINHYGGKEELATAAYEHMSKQITLRRYTPEPGDVRGALEALVEDYEITGDAVIRMLALEEKVPTLAPLLAHGRAGHRGWVEEMFLRPGARARAGGGHRRLHLEAPASRPGAQPRGDPGGDVANRPSSTRTEDSMTTPKRYLFAIIDGGGTVPADTSVIRAMVERGHDVRVLADRVLAPDIETTGAEHVVWDRAPQRPNLDPQSVIMKDWDTKTPFEAFGRVRDGAMVGSGGAVRRGCAERAPAPPCGRRRGQLLRLRRPDRGRGRGRAVRVPRVEPALVPGLEHAAARPGPEARSRTARASARRWRSTGSWPGCSTRVSISSTR